MIPQLTASTANEVQWSKPAYARIARTVAARAGLTFPENRREITEAALRRAMAHAGEASPDQFADRVEHDPETYTTAITELTVGETYFFRDPAQWELIRTHVVPDLMRVHPDGRGVRVWSAGCASGEEAYTLGIVLREAGCVAPSISGTDLCEHRLHRASRAVYTKWSMRGVDDATRRRYFASAGQYFHLLPEFRDVGFRAVNLAAGGYGSDGQELSALDLILCRNVLIYIEPEVTTAIFSRLVSALRPGGWLMVAASDPQPDAGLALDVVVTDAGLLYRKRDAAALVAESLRLVGAFPGSDQSDAVSSAPDTYVRVARPVQPPTPPSEPAPAAAREALAAYRGSDYAQVIEIADRQISLGADTASTWIALTRSYANLGRLTEAASACARAISRHPGAAELYILDSSLAAQQNQHAAAADSARRALYVDRTLAAAHVALGTALLRANDPHAADRALRAAERLLSDTAPTAIVQASDGTTVADMLSTVRAHRALLAAGALRAS